MNPTHLYKGKPVELVELTYRAHDEQYCTIVIVNKVGREQLQTVQIRKILPLDDLLSEAKEHCLKQGYVSVSYLQRRLRITYMRAARIVDLMIAQGFCERKRQSNSPHFRICTPS